MVPALVLTFLVVPLVELYLVFRVSQQIGLPITLAILLGVSVLGAVLVKREGARAWSAFRDAVGRGTVPGREVADGALVLIGGALLLTPGFLTDAVGLFLVLPFSRPLARAGLLAFAMRRQRRLRVRRPGSGRVIDVPPDDRRTQ